MNKTVKMLLIFVGFPILIAGNVYFYFTEKAKQLPEIEFTLIDGKKLTVDELKGKTVLLNFWATTCAPCRKEMPDLVGLYHEFSEKDVQIIGISMAHDRPDQVIAFQQQYKIPYTLAMDIDSVIVKSLSVEAIPLTLLISPRGQIEYRHIGVINVDDMRNRIAAMLPDERS